MDSDYDTSSDKEFSVEDFRVVRRDQARPGADQEGGADADAVPISMMAALSPEPPSSPVSGDAQSQPRAGTDQEDEDAVDAPMAIEWRSSPDPAPARSESGARRRQPTYWLRPRGPPQTVESIFYDFTKRRAAFIRALTTDEEAFFEKCDPGMQPLQLYGGTDGTWEVKPPELKLPAPEPQPIDGINIVRDTMERHKWLEEVAAHCDAWLIRISHFAASMSYMKSTEWRQLFNMISSLPTIQKILVARSDSCKCTYHVEQKRSSGLEANAVVEEKEEGSSGPHEANEVVAEEQEVYPMEEQRSSGPTEADEVMEEVEEDATTDDSNFCASCDSLYNTKAFWISCDSCEKWYHGKCVNITSSEAEHMETLRVS